MPFSSPEQALYLLINHPDIFNRWKKKYGLPPGYNEYIRRMMKKKKGVRVTESASEYKIGSKAQTLRAHSLVHSNFSSEDGSYYRRIHRKIVSALQRFGLTHKAKRGDTLDESLPNNMRINSKWDMGVEEVQNAG